MLHSMPQVCYVTYATGNLQNDLIWYHVEYSFLLYVFALVIFVQVYLSKGQTL